MGAKRVTGQKKYLVKKKLFLRGIHIGQIKHSFQSKKHVQESNGNLHVQLSWNWRHLLVVLVKKNFYFSQKKHFSVSTSSLQSQSGWLSPSLQVHLGQKKHFYQSKKHFCVSTEVCNLRRCTNACPCKVPGPSSWVLDTIGQPGLSLFLTLAVSMELLEPRGHYDGIQSNKIGYRRRCSSSHTQDDCILEN